MKMVGIYIIALIFPMSPLTCISITLYSYILTNRDDVRKKKNVLNIGDPNKLEKKNSMDGCCGN